MEKLGRKYEKVILFVTFNALFLQIIVVIPYNKDNLYRWQNPVAGSQNLFWEPRNSTVCKNVVIFSGFFSEK